VPKTFLLRTAAVALLGLWAFEAALSDAYRTPRGANRLRSAFRYARSHLIPTSAAAVLLVTSVSAIASPIRAVSIGGVNLEHGSHALISIACYLAVFAVVASHLKTLAQLRRLLWALTGSSMLAGLYGVAQHYGIDPFRADSFPISRAPLSFGNPLFAASFMLMIIPLSLALWQGWRDRMTAVNHIWIGGGLIALQITGMAFTLSRGPLIGLVVALVVFLGAVAWLFGPRATARPAASLALAITFAAIMTAIPVEGASDVTLASRFSEVGSPLAASDGALSSRVTIWGVALDAFTSVPWVDTREFPEIPGLAFSAARPVLGYGPDMFGYAYVQVGDPTLTSVAESGHSFIVHTAVELGLLGVFAYLALAVSVAVSLGRALAGVKRTLASAELRFILAGLIGVFVGRAVEQMTGTPQLSDLMLFWVLVAVVQAFPTVMGTSDVRSGQASSTAISNRRARDAARARSVPMPFNSIRVAGAVGFAVAALIFWWQVVATPANADLIAGRGLNASFTGRPTVAGELLSRAADLAPTSYAPAALLADAWMQNAEDSSDPDFRGQAFSNAYSTIRRVFERDPFNLRARMAAGEISRAMALDSPSFTERAIDDYELVVALLPGLWEQREQLAWTLTSVGEHERALEVVTEAKQLGGADNPDAYFLYYVEGKALKGLGRDREVADIIRVLNAIDNRFVVPLIEDLVGP
jgi:hypothetical protein